MNRPQQTGALPPEARRCDDVTRANITSGCRVQMWLLHLLHAAVAGEGSNSPLFIHTFVEIQPTDAHQQSQCMSTVGYSGAKEAAAYVQFNRKSSFLAEIPNSKDNLLM